MLWFSRRENKSRRCFWSRPFLTAFARFSNENISNNTFVDFIRLVGHFYTFFCRNWFFLCTCSSVISGFFGAVTCAWSKGLVINLPRRRSLKKTRNRLRAESVRGTSVFEPKFPIYFPTFSLDSEFLPCHTKKWTDKAVKECALKGCPPLWLTALLKRQKEEKKKITPEANFSSRHILFSPNFFPHWS